MNNQESFPLSCSVLECQMAREVFTAAYLLYAPFEKRETAIKIALAAVWSNARKYQMEQQEAHHD